MAIGSNNPFPSALIVEGTVPATPASGQQRLYIDSTTHLLKVVNSSGTASNVSTGMSNVLTTTGDIIYSSSGTTAARLAIGAATTVLHGGTTPAYSAVVEGDLSTSDITTANATTSKHGFLLKLNNSATQFMNGQGAWATPSAGALTTGENFQSGTASLANDYTNYTDICSVSLAAGTWLVMGFADSTKTAAGTALTFRTWDGTNEGGHDDHATNGIPAGDFCHALQGLHVLGGTTTVKLQAKANATGHTVGNGHLVAIKVA